MKLLYVIVSILFAGCAATNAQEKESPLKERAAYDFECEANQIEYENLTYATWVVKGCGHRAVYVCIFVYGCFLNSPVDNIAKTAR